MANMRSWTKKRLDCAEKLNRLIGERILIKHWVFYAESVQS